MTILHLRLTRGQVWDLAGIGASTLCVAHCLASPVLAVLIPVLEAIESQTHTAFAMAILGIGLLAFWPGFRRHGRWQIVAAALVGFEMISLGIMVPEGLMSESAEATVTVVGGVILISAHLRNAYFCGACRVCGDHDCLTN